MDIKISSRNADLDNALREHINSKLKKLEKLYSRIYLCDVVLKQEKSREIAEIILFLKKNKVIAKESSQDMYASIDLAVESIKKQLTRLSGRLRSRRRGSMLRNLMRPVMRFRGLEEPAVFTEEVRSIIKTRAFADKPMLPEEAKLELEISDKIFMVFKNADTGETNVIYKRTDGNYGLIEPNF